MKTLLLKVTQSKGRNPSPQNGAARIGSRALVNHTDTVASAAPQSFVGIGELSSMGSEGGMLSPGKSPRVREYADEFRTHWHNAVESVFKMAECCARAKEVLTSSEKEEFLNEVGLTAASFSKIVKIARDPRLQATEMRRKLPPRWTVIYEIASLNAGDFNDAVSTGVVHPNMTRGSLKKWLESRSRTALPQVVSPATAIKAIRGADALTLDAGSSDAPVESARSNAGSASTKPADPTLPLRGLDAIPAFLDRRPLSPQEQRDFDALEAVWTAASELVRERFKAVYWLPSLK